MNDIFQNYAVQLGMQHEFLMDSILAFTCLHLAAERVESDSDPWPFISDAIQLSERSLPVFRAELTNISSSNFEAVLICSMIVMAYGTVVHAFDLKYDSESKEDLETHFEAFMSMPSLVRGIHSVIDDTNPWLDQSPLKDVVRLYPKEYWTSPPHRGTSTIPPELRKMCDHQSSQRQKVYSRAILMLENSSAREDGMTIAWVVEVGEEFGNLLQKKEPIALLIYICWGALLGRSTDIWWRRLAGRNVVKSFSSSVTVGGDEAKTVLDWARSQVDIEK